jgi:hypothetical protein
MFGLNQTKTFYKYRMSASNAWAALNANTPVATSFIDVEDEGSYDCFPINIVPALQALTTQRHPQTQYVSVERLEPEGEPSVFNLTFFNEDSQVLGGAELTQTKIYWDDE